MGIYLTFILVFSYEHLLETLEAVPNRVQNAIEAPTVREGEVRKVNEPIIEVRVLAILVNKVEAEEVRIVTRIARITIVPNRGSVPVIGTSLIYNKHGLVEHNSVVSRHGGVFADMKHFEVFSLAAQDRIVSSTHV